MEEKKQEDNRYQAPWIPLTPHRPILSQPRPIYPDMQVNQPEQVNWPETKGVVPVATILGLESLPFRDLLALADASRSETSSGSLYPNFSLRLRKWVSSNEIIETPQYAIPSSRRPYDLNLPPEDVSDVSDKNTAEFAPITPEKRARGDDNHISETNISGINQEQKQAKEVVNTMPKLNKVSCNKELQDHVAESSPKAASEQNPNINKKSSHRMDQIKTASEQNLNINKRSSHRMEQIKTPQQKPKRKKHRPKVIIEGKTKEPVKPKTPKPAVSPRKRAYITEKRDKEDMPSLSTETAADSDVRTLRPKRLTRRVLDFVYNGDLEDENYSSSQHSDCRNEVQKKCTASAIGEAQGKRCPSIHNPLIRSGNSRNTLTEDRDEDSGRKCLTAFLVQFPNIQKKQRTNKSHSSSSSITVLGAMKDIIGLETHDENNPHTDPSETIDNYHISAPSCTHGGPDAKGDPIEGLLRGFHTSEGLTGSRKTQLFKRKRSRSVNRARNMASLNRIVYCDLSLGFSEEPQTIEALISEIQSTVSRKKRTKRNLLVNQSFSTKRLQLRSGFFFQHHHPFSIPSVGTSADELWKQLYSVDAISEQFKRLDINRESTCITYQEKNAIVPYKLRNQERNTLLLYKRDRVMVPSGGSFYPVKKQNPRPKVYLDDETNRVWKLLMENINNEGIDGTDEEKEKRWEEERSVFSGRADSFIARMRLVQGDRSFSPWKGSVVDSVIGVFLTQNVSDHLSSSAFMSMAATFPSKNTSCHEDGGSSVTHDETLKYLVDSGDTISSPLVCKQSSIIIHETNHNEETDRVDCDQTSRTYRSSSSSTNKSMYMLTSPVENALGTDPEERQSKTEAELNNINYFRRGRRPMHISTQIFVKSQDSYNSSPSPIADATGLCSDSNSDWEDICRSPRSNGLDACSLTELPQMSVTMLQGKKNLVISSNPTLIDGLTATESNNDMQYMDNQIDRSSTPGISNISYGSRSIPDQVVFDAEISKSWQERLKSDKNKSQPSYKEAEEVSVQSQSEVCVAPRTINRAQDHGEKNKTKHHTSLENQSREILDITESIISHDYEGKNQYQTAELNVKKQRHPYNKKPNMMNATKSKGQPMKKQKTNDFDWDSLRRDTESNGHKRERTARTRDSVDWEAVRCADVDDIAKTIRARGMNNMLAERIKAFLNRLDKEHGSVDLEWLRDVPPDKAKEYLLSIRGLGLKSVECVRLLTLHHLAFPVDTNVGRIAVRLGWVPLQPLPESLQLHLLELYPVLESIQKYLWPRLCKLDQRTLYELHYQMISFGKVFCTKSKPNCNACPMRGECRHFASAFASARLALPGPEERRIIGANERTYDPEPAMAHTLQQLFLPQATRQPHGEKSQNAKASAVDINLEANDEVNNTEPIIEEPATPEPECTQVSEYDIEDAFYEDTDEIPTIKLNMEAFSQNLQTYMLRNMELQEADVSNALVALSAEAASIPMPKLKNMSRLRTEHQVYELPDSHPLLAGFDKREPDDPCSYLLAIWTPGETANSIEQPEKRCSSQGSSILCQEETCLSCNSVREAKSQIVRGTLLIPCRTAMRGSFPLNGTYFQVNEVFADNDSSLNPIDVPRNWIWNLPRRTVYFGTSIPTIFRGLTTEEIQHCFWRGYVCVRGFDQKTRAPRPLMARLHFPVSKLAKSKNRTDAENN